MTTSGTVRRHPSVWCLWPTLAVAWIVLAHVVSFQGLAIWVIGGSALTALVVLPLALAGRRLLALAAMPVMTFAVPMLAEWLGGNTAGPVTRASLMACATTAAMALILPTRYPLAMLVPSLLLLGGALGLGGAGTALWVVGLWLVAAAVTAAMLGPFRQTHLRDRVRLVPFAVMLAGAGLLAVIALIAMAPFLRNPWTMPGSVLVAVPDALAVRELEFRKVALAEVSAYAGGYMLVTLPLAYAGFGVWSLLCGLIAKGAVRVSLGKDNQEAEIDGFLDALQALSRG